MAITYTNIADQVVDSLNTLIADEFSVPIYVDEHKGNQSFLILPQEDELEQLLTGGQIRNYTTLISYELDSGGNYGRSNFKRVSTVSERLKRLLYNNRNYSPSGTYKYQDGVVDNITYERDPDNPDVIRALTTFGCTIVEIIA